MSGELQIVEEILKNYKILKNKEASLNLLLTNFDTFYIKGIEYGVEEGRKSSNYITGNQAIEETVIKKEELKQKIDEIKETADKILEIVEQLKYEKNGEELFNAIKLAYLDNKENNYIQEKLSMSRTTLHRRKNEAVEQLKNKGLEALHIKIKVILKQK